MTGSQSISGSSEFESKLDLWGENEDDNLVGDHPRQSFLEFSGAVRYFFGSYEPGKQEKQC